MKAEKPALRAFPIRTGKPVRVEAVARRPELVKQLALFMEGSFRSGCAAIFEKRA